MASILKKFTDCDELFDTVESETILAWVNELAKIKRAQKDMGTRYRLKQQILSKLAKELLDPDELKRVDEQVGEEV